MKKSIAHLPKDKYKELRLIRDIILEKIPDVRMIILFGSYARGDWVEDTHTEGHVTHVYESDFDILVATKSKKEAESIEAHNRVDEAIAATGKVHTPLSIIYHTFGYVKERITEGQYFFTDIKKEGIQFYCKKGKFDLGAAKILTPEERKTIAQEYFNQWFKKGKDSCTMFKLSFEKKLYKESAFNLHQATERFYSAITLVFINYRFRSHDIEMLGRKAVGYNAEFAKVFPRETKEQDKIFKLLKRAYVDARYKKNYRITRKQLEYLAKCVKKLQRLAKKICGEKIESFI